MAATGFFHHIGTFLLFASCILLLIPTISAPVINDFGLLKVTLTNQTNGHNSSIHFGTWGYCVSHPQSTNDDKYYCTGKHIGYSPASIMNQIESTSFSHASSDTTKALTRVMVLHPVACGLAFISFLLALGAGFIGSLLASIVAFLTFIVTVVVMACDFVLFGIVKNHVNGDGSGSHAYFSESMWCVLAGMVAGLLGMLLVFVSCCSKRLHERREKRRVAEKGYPGGVVAKRRWWQRKRY
ncbi:ph-response regulator protein [Rutstroemia sp. NJR-2017a BBW]|nr:ph-response regulator protein [Rutstroemia sp. NJR-2017a BBW]